jgi:hypothetical protein
VRRLEASTSSLIDDAFGRIATAGDEVLGVP